MTKRVVVIPGDDAAPEAVHPTIELIDQLELDIEWLYPYDQENLSPTEGFPLPPSVKEMIDSSDSTLFGSTSTTRMRAPLFYLRWGKQTYANLRPCRYIPGYRSPLANPDGIDFVIVRENLEDLYVRTEGALEELTPLALKSHTAQNTLDEMQPGKYAVKVITEVGCERIVKAAFELAVRRQKAGRPGHVTCTSKYNMLPQTDGLFRDIATSLAKAYPEIGFRTLIIDDFAHRMIIEPQVFDVVVMPNLYGDILSDGAGSLMGGLGLAASGCLGDDYAYFEPAHGSAPDIQGKNIINPTATLISAAMMLEYLGFEEAAKRLTAAMEAVYAAGTTLTPDQGGSASTTEFSNAVAAQL